MEGSAPERAELIKIPFFPLSPVHVIAPVIVQPECYTCVFPCLRTLSTRWLSITQSPYISPQYRLYIYVLTLYNPTSISHVFSFLGKPRPC
jgi:hypothetical protein